MVDLASDLLTAFDGAQQRLTAAARGAMRAQTPFADGASDGRMAELAQNATFAEALLAAMHARLTEIKAATK